MGTPEQANMGLDLFELIDVDNNGKISRKELMAFMAIMYSGCEDKDEQKAITWLCECFTDMAYKNGLGDDDEITAVMFKDYEPSEKMNEKAMEGLEAGLKDNEDQVRAILKEANSKSE